MVYNYASNCFKTIKNVFFHQKNHFELMGRNKTPENVEVHEVQDVTDLRARLRRTGQIEEGSGLHRIELARKHSQRIIDVQ